MARASVFEPFLAWVNSKLASATWLRIFRMRGGGSCATLIRDDADLDREDPGIRLLLGLKKLVGQSVCVPGVDDAEVLLIPVSLDR